MKLELTLFNGIFMELIIGGRNQGKREYARELFKEYTLCDIKDMSKLGKNGYKAGLILLGINDFVLKKIKEDKGQDEIYKELLEIINCFTDVIIITDEIGNGIVPLDPTEREFRDLMGRIQIKLAKEAIKVHRVICGIGMIIKE